MNATLESPIAAPRRKVARPVLKVPSPLIGARTACPPASDVAAPRKTSGNGPLITDSTSDDLRDLRASVVNSANANRTFPDDILKQFAAQFANPSSRTDDDQQQTDDTQLFLKASMTIASMDFFTIFFTLMNTWARLMQVSLAQQKREFQQKQAEAKQRDRERKLRLRKPILITNATITFISSPAERVACDAQAPSRNPVPGVSSMDTRRSSMLCMSP